jgi:hypothetical protein
VQPVRLAVGFAAGFLSVLVFSHGMIAVLHPAGLFPFGPWDMTPVPPLGVLQTFSGAFWGGLWGAVYALLEPRLTARLGWWQGGIVFGAVLPMLVFWFVVMTLKGAPAGLDFFLSLAALVSVALHTFFGLGTAVFFRLGARLTGRSDRLPA